MDEFDRQSKAEYLDSHRQLKKAWDSFYRHSYRQTFIHCRLALNHMIKAVLRIERKEGCKDPLRPFFEIMGSHIPLDKAENFTMILNPPELKPLSPAQWNNLSESISDWLITRKIDRPRAFDHLILTQETINLAINIIEKKYPSFFKSSHS